jgi:predicted GNAT superfamily acetyltransferase
MPESKSKAGITIRDLKSFLELKKVEALEKEVWGLSDLDAIPMTLAVATREVGSIWVGAFDGNEMVGFAFAFFGIEGGYLMAHSHMLAVRQEYRDSDLGYKLKLAQRERVMGLRIREMSWTFDPLQSKNAHFNFDKLGVVSSAYKVDFYGPETSSVLHRNSTDRLWVRWPLASRRVQDRLQGKEHRTVLLEALATLTPLIRFNAAGAPERTDLAAALGRQRIAIEIPSDIGTVERENSALAREWRLATRWAFTEALNAGFFVAEFCRMLRGKQGPGAYLLEKGTIEEYVPELQRAAS